MAILKPDDDEVLDALVALRDGGLVTDRHQLNRAWAELTGRTPPPPPPSTPAVAVEVATGPCANCGARITRYGSNGRPLCRVCRQPSQPHQGEAP